MGCKPCDESTRPSGQTCGGTQLTSSSPPESHSMTHPTCGVGISVGCDALLEGTMKFTVRGFMTLGILLTAVASVGAQGRPVIRPPVPPIGAQMRPGAALRRERMMERMREARAVQPGGRLIRSRVMARRALLRDRISAMTPAQRQQLRDARQGLRAERQRIGERMRNGSITRDQARQHMHEWRKEHRPNLGLRGPRRPGGGGF